MHREKARHIVLISDLHVGAMLAPVPMAFDNECEGFDFREWVRACFSEFCDDFVPRITNNEPFVLVVNGDLIHGDWHRFGMLALATKVKQVRAARELLKPIAMLASAVYIVDGTEIHTSCSEHDIAEELLQVANVRPAHKAAAHKELSLTVNGLHHRFRHHTNVAGRTWTSAGGQANHLADDILRCRQAGVPAPDILCLGHRHVHGLTLDGNGMSVVTPAWSGVDRHARAKTREDFGNIGGCIMSYAGREKGEFPDVRFYLQSAARSLGKCDGGLSLGASGEPAVKSDNRHPARPQGKHRSRGGGKNPRKAGQKRKSNK
jgi:hypothetical protein